MQRNLYTDLALEARELNPDITGVVEDKENDNGIEISRISITDDAAAQRLGKSKGKYVTMDAPDLVNRMPDMFERTSKRLAQEITALAGDAIHQAPTLVVGLGNRFVTPDALGPRVVDKIYVTRHITKYMPDLLQKKLKEVSAIAPGVLGVTGVETAEVVRGVVKSVQPALIIVIDSLASRRAARISTTIQLADTGISPGSGVGNVRAELNRESLGVPVIAIGVPMVVYASTISKDTISLIADETGLHNDEEKLLDLADKVISEHIGPLIVTPKDIDTILDYMSTILADGINLALHDVDYEDVKTLLA